VRISIYSSHFETYFLTSLGLGLGFFFFMLAIGQVKMSLDDAEEVAKIFQQAHDSFIQPFIH